MPLKLEGLAPTLGKLTVFHHNFPAPTRTGDTAVETSQTSHKQGKKFEFNERRDLTQRTLPLVSSERPGRPGSRARAVAVHCLNMAPEIRNCSAAQPQRAEGHWL